MLGFLFLTSVFVLTGLTRALPARFDWPESRETTWTRSMVRRDCLGIVAAVFIVHGLLLLNDGEYWEGWIWQHYYQTGDWAGVLSFMLEAGTPLRAHLYWLPAFFPDPIFGTKLISFVSLAGAAVLTYLAGLASERLTRWESLALALIAMSYPAYQATVSTAVVTYSVTYFSFLLGVYLALKAEEKRGGLHLVLRLAALTAFVWSFVTPSMLTFYGGFLIVLLAKAGFGTRPLRPKGLVRFCLVRADYVLLPAAFYLVMVLVFPPTGWLKEYLSVSLSPVGMWAALKSFLLNGVHYQLDSSLASLFTSGLWLGALAGLAAWFLGSRFQGAAVPERSQPAGAHTLLIFGLVLFVLGAGPYIAGGRTLAPVGFYTRFALLLPLPVAFIIIGLVRMVFKGSAGGVNRLGLVVLATLVAAFSWSTMGMYIDWQARWVRDRSFVLNLSRLDRAADYSIFIVDNRYRLGGQGNYNHIEYSALFNRAFGDDTHFGLDRGYNLEKTIARYTGRWGREYGARLWPVRADLKGCRAIIEIEKGAAAGPSRSLVARYFYHRFFDRRGMDGFLAGVTRLRLQPLNVPQAENCRPE